MPSDLQIDLQHRNDYIDALCDIHGRLRQLDRPRSRRAPPTAKGKDRWHVEPPIESTRALVDCVFACALAELRADRSVVEDLIDSAREPLLANPLHELAFRAYDVRVRGLLAGVPRECPLPTAWYASLYELERMDRYRLVRLSENSQFMNVLDTCSSVTLFLEESPAANVHERVMATGDNELLFSDLPYKAIQWSSSFVAAGLAREPDACERMSAWAQRFGAYDGLVVAPFVCDDVEQLERVFSQLEERAWDSSYALVELLYRLDTPRNSGLRARLVELVRDADQYLCDSAKLLRFVQAVPVSLRTLGAAQAYVLSLRDVHGPDRIRGIEELCFLYETAAVTRHGAQFCRMAIHAAEIIANAHCATLRERRLVTHNDFRTMTELYAR